MSKTAKLVQIFLLATIVAAGIRLYLVYRERHEPLSAGKKTEVALDPDYYVTPKKLHPQDLQDAQELTKQPVWVKIGYGTTYYSYSGHTDFDHPAGTLGPLEKLDIQNVVLDRTPGSATQKQVMAVFEKDGKRFAFPIGVEENGDYRIYSDEMLFIQDPHELYNHWPASVWKEVDNHQVRLGMSELQATFAIGLGSPEGSGLGNPRMVNFPNNGHPLEITFTNGKASNIHPGS